MVLEPTKEEQTVINSLKRLAKRWPKNTWIWACGSGSLYIMRSKLDGSPAMTATGGVDQDYIIAEINIPNDGGAW